MFAIFLPGTFKIWSEDITQENILKPMFKVYKY